MSEVLEKAIKKLCLNRSDWEVVKFGDVAIQQKKSVDRDTTGITKYVKGEHMNSEDLHLREWGELEDEYLGPAFIRLFDEGDILYGSRRTYLRKVTIAPFEGITSNTTFVMKANEKKINKRLLPFVMLSEGFAEHSIKNSKGSVNPYVNWKDLADYEFLLPPKKQQDELAELLWAMDEVIEKDLAVLGNIIDFENILVENLFNNDEILQRKNWKKLSLQELLDTGVITSHLDGNHGSYYPKAEEFVEDGVPYISANCIEVDEIKFDKAKFLTESRASKISKGIAISGDVLLAHNATVGPVCILETEYEKVILSTSLTYYRTNPEKLNNEYLFYYMRSRTFQVQLERIMSQSTRNQVPITTQRQLLFILPPFEEQANVIMELKTFFVTRKNTESKISASKALQKSLINEVF